MPGRTTIERRELRRVVAITLLVLTLVIAGAAGLMAYAAAGIDRVQAAKERELAHIRLDRTLDGLVENINSSAIWDDSVYAFVGPLDPEWLQGNFGDYYADFMGHAVTLVYDQQGRMVLASRDSEPVAAASEQPLIDAVAPLVADARREAAGKRDRPRLGFDAAVSRTAVVRAGSELHLVGLSTVVGESASTPRLAGDPIVVSTKPISSLLSALENDLAFQQPTLTEPRPAGESDGYLVLRGADDTMLGQVEWAPARPGFSVLRGAAPAVAALILLLVAAAVVLLLRVRAIVQRLEVNELDLTEARDRAESANIAKTRFLGVMSHELRTPLNGVLGMAEILGMGELDARQRSHLAVLKESGESLLALIERILTVARLEKGELITDPGEVDAAALLHSVAKAHRPAADRAGLALIVEADDSSEGLWRLDGDHLRQVLNHLVDNALRHTSRGSVRLGVRAVGSELEFRVADTGVGIAPARLPELFAKFVQADDTHTRACDGAGVGLTLARGLVEAMGGTVRAMSTPGMGSIFTVHLPAHRIASAASATRQAA